MVSQTNENGNLDTLGNKEQLNTLGVEKQKFFDEIKKSNIKEETKNNIKKILEKISDDDFFLFIDALPELASFIDSNTPIDIVKFSNQFIDSFINHLDNTSRENGEKKGKSGAIYSDGNDNKENELISKMNESTSKEALKFLESRKDYFKKIFGENSEFFQLFEKYKDGDLEKELTKFLSNKDNAKEFFQTLNEKNPALYKETYNAVIAISPELAEKFTAWGIPSESYKDEQKPIIPPEIVAQLPGAKPEDIEKRGNLVSYNGKTIDLKTGKAFISGEGGYAIETSMQVPNSLDIRAKYLAERLEILDEIKTNENKIYEVEEYQKTLQYEKALHEQYEKLALNHDIDSNLAKMEIESKLLTIKKYKELVEERYPTIKENPEEPKNKALGEIEKLKTELKTKKTQFDADMQELLEAGQDEIKARDEKVRETISFLDDLGITNINQHDLQKIINRININPQAYGFSKPIDLKRGFEGEATDILKQKREFFNFFAKMYEKMGLTNPPVNPSVIEGVHKDTRLKNDTTFKQNMEDSGVTLGGSLQIETFFTLIKEEPENKQNTTEN